MIMIVLTASTVLQEDGNAAEKRRSGVAASKTKNALLVWSVNGTCALSLGRTTASGIQIVDLPSNTAPPWIKCAITRDMKVLHADSLANVTMV
jgi:hypothetical protein